MCAITLARDCVHTPLLTIPTALCVGNCPSYTLPNTFTPSSKPFPFRFIDRVEFSVFNLWGALGFETSDPALNWDGKT